MPVVALAAADSSSKSRNQGTVLSIVEEKVARGETSTTATLDSCRLLLKYLFCRRQYDCADGGVGPKHETNIENNTVYRQQEQENKGGWPCWLAAAVAVPYFQAGVYDRTGAISSGKSVGVHRSRRFSSQCWKSDSSKRRSDTSSIISAVSTGVENPTSCVQNKGFYGDRLEVVRGEKADGYIKRYFFFFGA